MNLDKLNSLRIDQDRKQRPKSTAMLILVFVGAITASALYFAWPRESDAKRVLSGSTTTTTGPTTEPKVTPSSSANSPTKPSPTTPTPTARTSASNPSSDSILTVSGYIINRERIEISPRFMGMVKWIGVKKGDSVTNGQIVVRLDDSEYRARLKESEGRLAQTKVAINRAELDLKRAQDLADNQIESQKQLDDARLQLLSSRAAAQEAQGSVDLTQTYLDWCIIRSPVTGVILEKLVDPGELVTPQSFGGTRGPSTALLAVADPKDLQVEIDVNESDLSKISLNQKCRVSPEAYSDKSYDGIVAEIAPEASRQKGTLQIKVQILNPDRFLTPELSARVDFLPIPAAVTPKP